MQSADPLRRFSSRVEDYVRYRPSYPPQVTDLLRSECGLHEGGHVADLGSGTGLLTELLLGAGAEVWGIEPNPEMRTAGEQFLASWPRFHSVGARAEATGLADGSIDLVTVGQAFHWFEPDGARRECRRILKPNGRVALVWNERIVESTPFLAAYEALLKRHSAEYEKVDHRRIQAPHMDAFFGSGAWKTGRFPNSQTFDFEGVKGRLLSSSYAPPLGSLESEPMMAELRTLFDRTEREGMVAFEYATIVYWGVPLP